MTSNPNAAVSAFAGAITVVLAFVLGQVGVNLTPEVNAAITTLVISASLFFGSRRPKG